MSGLDAELRVIRTPNTAACAEQTSHSLQESAAKHWLKARRRYEI